jgi:hypothetical protein
MLLCNYLTILIITLNKILMGLTFCALILLQLFGLKFNWITRNGILLNSGRFKFQRWMLVLTINDFGWIIQCDSWKFASLNSQSSIYFHFPPRLDFILLSLSQNFSNEFNFPSFSKDWHHSLTLPSISFLLYLPSMLLTLYRIFIRFQSLNIERSFPVQWQKGEC